MPLGIDVSLVHAAPLHSTESRETRARRWSQSVEQCLGKRETDKVTKYKALCDQASLDFSPFVASTYGTLGASAKQVLRTLADVRASARYSDDPAVERHMRIQTYWCMAADINRAIIKSIHGRIHRCVAKAAHESSGRRRAAQASHTSQQCIPDWHSDLPRRVR